MLLKTLNTYQIFLQMLVLVQIIVGIYVIFTHKVLKNFFSKTEGISDYCKTNISR